MWSLTSNSGIPVLTGREQGGGRWTTTLAMRLHWRWRNHIANEKVVHAKAQRSSPITIRVRAGAAADRPQLLDRTGNSLRVFETRPGGGGHLATARRLG